jgi:predicted GTPase
MGLEFMTQDTIEKYKNQFQDRQITVKENISESLSLIAANMLEAGDQGHARKLHQLIGKYNRGEMIITFSGHFSAGKSSLINELAGHSLLPSSPIPTSANVVTIKSGEPQVKLHLTSGEQKDFDFTGNLEEVRAYCVNGAEVESIEISYPLLWPETLLLMDTPGIDSTDDAHKLSTESALHLADIVIYTMDYNHVQSELNFHFVKSLQDQGKSVVLVVNQIDKHQAAELPFESFRQSVEEAFSAWQIEPMAIFYTSIMRKDHPFNQLSQLKSALSEWMDKRSSLIAEGLVHSSLELIEGHMVWLRAQQGEKRSSFEEILEQTPSLQDITMEVNQLNLQIKSNSERPLRLEQTGKKEIDSIIQNANLTPFPIRELAERFLESQKPNFKVGLFFTANKTLEEQKARLDAFHVEFSKQVSAHLEWHLKETLIRIQEQDGSATEEYLTEVHEMHLDIEPQLLVDQIHQGALASFSGQYVLQYSQDLAQAMKNAYRKKALSLLEKGLHLSEAKSNADLGPLRQKISSYSQVIDALEGLRKLDQKLDEKSKEFMNLLLQNVKHGESSFRKLEKSPVTPSADASATTYKGNKYSIDWGTSEQQEQKHEKSTDGPYKAKLQQTAEGLRQTAHLTKEIAGLKTSSNAMIGRAERLEKNLFTVALFGAFSAGKSSFANALMGNRVLPVSPNPTTATINKVLPPNAENPHGTVRVKLKGEKDLWNDLAHSLRIFEMEAPSMEQGIDAIKRLQPEDWSPSSKPHYSFLKAVEHGYESISAYLGQELIVSAEEFQLYVADEKKAAFVEWIELHYDCPLTRQGIALVDTPGADSINARHTGVAFEYIKNADAVLFVTYYNHAFSHADKNFLTQLGRVKDTFEMDKMFFVVNAADLAKDKEELESVIGHVSENLEVHGIRNARIYPISSQSAIAGKLGQRDKIDSTTEASLRNQWNIPTDDTIAWDQVLTRSGLPRFEKDFITFTIEELTQVAVSSSAHEVDRVRNHLEELLQSSKQDESERVRQKEAAVQLKKQALKVKIDRHTEVKSIEKEVAELLFYVKKRLLDRFNEFFQYSFNPAVLKDDGRNIKHTLRVSLEEMLQSIAHELAQEARATTLRVEKYLRKSQNRMFSKWEETLRGVMETSTFGLSAFDPTPLETPSFPLELTISDKKPLLSTLSLYKNARHFFEKDGKVAMRDTLEKQINPMITAHIEQLEQIFMEYYTHSFHEQMDNIQNHISDEVEGYYAGLMGMLSNEIDVESLEVVKTQLDHIVTGMRELFNQNK